MPNNEQLVELISTIEVEKSALPSSEDVQQMLTDLKSHESEIKAFVEFAQKWKSKPSFEKWLDASDARDNMLNAIAITGELTTDANKLALLNVVFAQLINSQTHEIKSQTATINSNCDDIKINQQEIRRFQQKADALSHAIVKVQTELEDGVLKTTTFHNEHRNDVEAKRKEIVKSIAELHSDIRRLTETDSRFTSDLSTLQNRTENISRRVDIFDKESKQLTEALRLHVASQLEMYLSNVNDYVESVLAEIRLNIERLHETDNASAALLNSMQNQLSKFSERIDKSDEESKLRVEALQLETSRQLAHGFLIQKEDTETAIHASRRHQNLNLCLCAASLAISILAFVLIFFK